MAEFRRRTGRPFAEDIVPAHHVIAAYRDLDTPVSVSASRLGIGQGSLSVRGRRLCGSTRAAMRAKLPRPTKRCTCCGAVPPATTEHFYADPRGTAGLKSRCITCTKRIERRRARRVDGD